MGIGDINRKQSYKIFINNKKQKNMNYKKDQFYIIRADKAGVFLCKVLKEDGNSLQVNNLRRLYRWAGALDVTQIAKDGVGNPNNCKFSVQLGDSDVSIIYNVIEAHTCTEKALQTLNSVPAWKQ